MLIRRFRPYRDIMSINIEQIAIYLTTCASMPSPSNFDLYFLRDFVALLVTNKTFFSLNNVKFKVYQADRYHSSRHTSTSQHVQGLNCSIDRMIPGPNDAITVEHPVIVFFQKVLIILGGRQPDAHVEFEVTVERSPELVPNREVPQPLSGVNDKYWSAENNTTTVLQ